MILPLAAHPSWGSAENPCPACVGRRLVIRVVVLSFVVRPSAGCSIGSGGAAAVGGPLVVYGSMRETSKESTPEARS